MNLNFVFTQIDVDNLEKEGKLAQIQEERGYNYRDQCECHPDTLPDYENKVKAPFLNSLKLIKDKNGGICGL